MPGNCATTTVRSSGPKPPAKKGRAVSAPSSEEMHRIDSDQGRLRPPLRFSPTCAESRVRFGRNKGLAKKSPLHV